MYKIIKDGVLVGITTAPTYIKMQENGCFGLCPREEAEGIAFDGKPYSLNGRMKMDGVEVASVEEDYDTTVSRDHTAAATVFVEQAEAGNIDENTALEHKGLFDEWAVGVDYTVGAMRQYKGLLYKCLQSHTSQEDWTPDATPALWVQAAAPNEYREIKDGMLSTEAFALGEIGWYKTEGNLYKSLIPANTYTPDTYPNGWEQVTG